MKKIYYWSPCLSNVGTVKSTINSCLALSRYNKNNSEIVIINSCGEWDKYKKTFEQNKIKIINLNFSYFKFLPKKGFFPTRISYFIIFLLSYYPLKKILRKNNPEFLIIHLITSLPIILMLLNNFQTKFILRISGFPKLNYFRKYLWKLASKKIKFVTSPTRDLIDQLKKFNIFNDNKVYLLPDAIINVEEFRNNLKNKIYQRFIDTKYFIAVGRLTKQKNFSYLIFEFKKFLKENSNYKLLIFGEGEEKNMLSKIVYSNNLKNNVYLMGHSNNVYLYMKHAKALILSSLWEDPGFVLIEAAFSNLFIISSNCKNGPQEILSNGKGGLLFNNNEQNALSEKIKVFSKLSSSEKKEMKIKTKKNCKKYSIFQHFLQLNNLLN